MGQTPAASRAAEAAKPDRIPATARRPAARRRAIIASRRNARRFRTRTILPAEFFELFLDPRMQYSCAYFAAADENLDVAQERKLDYICRKLRLKPGERFVDFGCGWGGLIVHAAKHYGVEAVGVTLVGRAGQARGAARSRQRLGRSRPSRRSATIANSPTPTPFDKAASIGMAEHIGNKNLPVYFAKVQSCLRPGGVYLHHSITLRPNTPYPRWTPFAQVRLPQRRAANDPARARPVQPTPASRSATWRACASITS